MINPGARETKGLVVKKRQKKNLKKFSNRIEIALYDIRSYFFRVAYKKNALTKTIWEGKDNETPTYAYGSHCSFDHRLLTHWPQNGAS
jgi:hypothetical protein